MRTLSNDLLQKVLTLVPLIATRLEVYVITTTTVIYDSYGTLQETLNNLKCLKLKIYAQENVSD